MPSGETAGLKEGLNVVPELAGLVADIVDRLVEPVHQGVGPTIKEGLPPRRVFDPLVGPDLGVLDRKPGSRCIRQNPGHLIIKEAVDISLGNIVQHMT